MQPQPSQKTESLFRRKRWIFITCFAALITSAPAAWNWWELQRNPSENTKRKFDASLDVVKTTATIAGAIVLYLNFRVASQNAAIANRNVEIAQRKLDQEIEKAKIDSKLAGSRLTMERFNKAVDMLGSDKSIHLRLGGIYALESIAEDSAPDSLDENYRQVLEVLTAFVRENSPYLFQKQEIESTSLDDTGKMEHDNELSPLPTDIQAVLTVLNRRKHRDRDWEQCPLDLRKTDLRRAQFGGANLQGAFLWDTNLQKAYLWGASLQGAKLSGANLQRAFLGEANLQGAFLRGAVLTKAIFWDSDLTNTQLIEAKERVKANIKSANNWETAKYDPEIRELLGLSQELVQLEIEVEQPSKFS